MSETVLTILRDPTVSLAALAVAFAAAAAAWATLPLMLIAVRRRLDAIESAQAETAAFMASETKRLALMIAQQRAEQIGESLRRTSIPAQDRPTERSSAAVDAKPVHQPLRKTIH